MATAADVGLVADKASTTVAPNADFLKARAQALEMLQDAIQRLRSNGATPASEAADRLEVIAGRLDRATPSQPDELEAIVADLNREMVRGIVGRPKGTIRSSAVPNLVGPTPERLSLLREVLGILRSIIDVLSELLRSLSPQPPYAPPPYPYRSPYH